MYGSTWMGFRGFRQICPRHVGGACNLVFVALVVFDVIAHFETPRHKLFQKLALISFAIAILMELIAYPYGKRNDELAGEQIRKQELAIAELRKEADEARKDTAFARKDAADAMERASKAEANLAGALANAESAKATAKGFEAASEVTC
jgi:hypothetical protein